MLDQIKYIVNATEQQTGSRRSVKMMDHFRYVALLCVHIPSMPDCFRHTTPETNLKTGQDVLVVTIMWMGTIEFITVSQAEYERNPTR